MELIWAAIFLGLLMGTANVISTWLSNRTDLAIAVQFAHTDKEETTTPAPEEAPVPIHPANANGQPVRVGRPRSSSISN